MTRSFIAILAALLLLSGCAGDYGKYAATLQTHSTAESERISAQSAAIAEMVGSAQPATPMEGTLLAVIGMMQVERLQFVPLPIQKPTTGMDVLNTATGHLPLAIMGLSSWGIAREGFKMAGDSNIFNGDAAIDNGFNKTFTTDMTTGSDVATSAVTSTTTAGEASPISTTAPSGEAPITAPSAPPEFDAQLLGQ